MDSMVTIVNKHCYKTKNIYKFVKHLLCASHYKC